MREKKIFTRDWLDAYLRLCGIDPHYYSYSEKMKLYYDVETRQYHGAIEDRKYAKEKIKGIPQFQKVPSTSSAAGSYLFWIGEVCESRGGEMRRGRCVMRRR